MSTENTTAGPCKVYRLSNGALVHVACREDYQKRFADKNNCPGIEAGLWEGYPMSRFQLCAHCEAPIWDDPKITQTG